MPIYLISKTLDPAFALAMGTAAALVRIRREEKEKHPDTASKIGFGSVLSLGGNRLGRWWNGEFDEVKGTSMTGLDGA
ncbi:uncharacterized protein BDV17DRAFT_291751 [Aspergillus undulatus]|uniref:uncharacterized protein n=1 Tax=Aspergillus undulatus TaxID=1810928 RepID=UPI003CCE0A4F